MAKAETSWENRLFTNSQLDIHCTLIYIYIYIYIYIIFSKSIMWDTKLKLLGQLDVPQELTFFSVLKVVNNFEKNC